MPTARGPALQPARASERPTEGGEPRPEEGMEDAKGCQARTLSLREPSPSLHPEREQRAHPTAHLKSEAATDRYLSTHEDVVLGNDRLTLKMLKMPVDFLNTSDLTKSSSCARVSSRWVMAQIPKQQARPWGGAQVCSPLGKRPTRPHAVWGGMYIHMYTKCHALTFTCTQSATHT